MSRFIKIFILFLIIIFSLAYGADLLISKGLRKSDIRMYQAWNDIYNSNIKGDAVILGSSRAWCQYDPEILDSLVGIDFYNLGIDGHKIDFQLIRYNTFRRFCEKPSYIIHNVEFSTLGLTKDGYEREQFFPYVFDDSLMNVVSKVKGILLLERKLPLIRYFGYRSIFEDGFKSYFGKNNLNDGGVKKGYRGNQYEWDGSKLAKIEKVDYEKDTKAIEMFSQYLSKANQEGVEVILVFAPLYNEAKQKLINSEDMYEMYENLAEKYNFKILNYSNDSISFDKNLFYNATHLNKKGAEIFSTKLAKDLKEIIYTQAKSL